MSKKAESSALVILILIALVGVLLYSQGHLDFLFPTNQTNSTNSTNTTNPTNTTNTTFPVTYEVIIFTTNSINKGANFNSQISEYITVLKDTENLDALYYEVANSNWINLRELIKSKLNPNGYLIILGDQNVVPVPEFTSTNPCVSNVKSDVHYLDFNSDEIPDSNLYVGRIPSKAIETYLENAINLHNQGGIQLTTAYSLISEPSRFTKMSQNNPINIAGHGSPTSFSDFQGQPLFTYSDFSLVSLNNNPLIIALTPCAAGLMSGENNFAEGFIRNGASIYVANLLAEGSPTVLIDEFNNLKNEQIGKTFMRGIIIGAQTTCGSSSHQLNLYGDPTLRMTGSSFSIFSIVRDTPDGVNCSTGICTCQC